MHLKNARLEQRIILAAMESKNPSTRRLVLAKTEPEDFATEPAIEARKFFQSQLKRGKDVQRARDTADTPALSDVTRTFVKATRKLRLRARNRRRKLVIGDIEDLKTYRRVRAAFSGLQNGGAALKGKAGKEELQNFCSILEKTLSEVRQEFDQQPMTHYGKGQSKKEAMAMAKRLVRSKKDQYISTGMDALDQHLHGFGRGHLVVLSAPRKGGKSAMAMNMAMSQYTNHHLNVLYCSLEMSREELEERMASMDGGVLYSQVQMPDQLGKYQRKRVERVAKNMWSIGQKNDCRFTVWPVINSHFTPSSLENATQGMGYDMIWLDYLTLMDKQKMDLWQMQMEYSRQFKQLALKQRNTIGILTQLNTNESVKYGTAVEENLNTWIKWPWREDEEAETGEVDVQLALCRGAKPAKFPSNFDMSRMTITMNPPSKISQSQKSVEGKERLNKDDKDFRRKLRKGDI